MNTTLDLLGSIPRTRARIIRFKHPAPFTNSVFSSVDKPAIPVYEETTPYGDKLPAEVREKSFNDATKEDALAHALAADKPDRQLDKLIWYKFIFDVAIEKARWLDSMATAVPHYTGSLDHAIKLYDTPPPMISTDPLDVVCDALRLHLLWEKHGA